MIGLSTSYFASKGCSIYESVSRTVELGFNLVELGAAHAYEEAPFDIVKKIKNDFSDINFTVHTLFPPLEKKIWFNPANGLNEENKEVIDGLLKSASILEASYVSIHPMVLNDLMVGEKIVSNFHKPIVSREKDPLKSKAGFFSLLEYIVSKTKETEVKVLIENMGALSRSYPISKRDYLEVFERFSEIGMLLDIAHATQYGNLQELITLEGKINEIHLHDLKRISKEEVGGHFPIKSIAYFDPLRELMKKDSLTYVFEHGSDCSEDDILKEKELLELVLGNKG